MTERAVQPVVLLFAGWVAMLGTALAADQAIMGKAFQLKDPQPANPARRTISGHARERPSALPIVGDPTQNGAAVTFFVNGTGGTSESFSLPQGVDPVSGKAFWNPMHAGFIYGDPRGLNGPVRMAKIRSHHGTFEIKVTVLGKLGAIGLVPPNPGTEACVRFDLVGGDSYHVLLPPAPASTITRNDANKFVLRNPTVTGLCPSTTTTTSTSSTTSSTIAAAVCGNGLREPGEQCDGGALCTAGCVQTIPSCCLFVDHCAAAPTFSLAGNLAMYCGALSGGVTPIAGGLCAADRSCAPVAIATVPQCCQLTGSCYDGSASSTAGLWSFLNGCTGAQLGTVVIGSACGSDGLCHPQ
jgi:hypothetical protein